jgi:serine/threonine protein kinase
MGNVMEPLRSDDPRRVGRYTLVARLDAGGMGRVYLGFSPAGRPMAVKVVHPELARDQAFLTRFKQEMAAARRVSGAYTARWSTPGTASCRGSRRRWYRAPR